MSDKKKKRGSKWDNAVDPDYLKEWDDFQENFETDSPLLLPISISIEDGIIARDRLKYDDISKMRSDLLAQFETHCSNCAKDKTRIATPYCTVDFEKILDEYLSEFESDNDQGPRPPSPLDFNISRPVWFLFYLPRENWTFSKHRQYSMENDHDDYSRNCEKICTLADERILILANHCRSKAKDLKYNLHITITQKNQKEKTLYTDIIIDPGMNNDTDW